MPLEIPLAESKPLQHGENPKFGTAGRYIVHGHAPCASLLHKQNLRFHDDCVCIDIEVLMSKIKSDRLLSSELWLPSSLRPIGALLSPIQPTNKMADRKKMVRKRKEVNSFWSQSVQLSSFADWMCNHRPLLISSWIWFIGNDGISHLTVWSSLSDPEPSSDGRRPMMLKFAAWWRVSSTNSPRVCLPVCERDRSSSSALRLEKFCRLIAFSSCNQFSEEISLSLSLSLCTLTPFDVIQSTREPIR